MPVYLKPAAIIPQELYVERAADRQLEKIISHMGRPGYVLVARQMGKTNLLINSKRKLERAGAIVVYIDLSNRFEAARTQFRYIIDRLAEISPTMMEQAHAAVLTQRIGDLLEPNVEYDRHLRLLLKATEARLIIVFDEIDSLIGVQYSDMIMSQVRSMYFARESFPEYNRLTFVLSGVVEPTDLIRDRNISPFNIGEKIYLEDFSRENVADLLDRARMRVTTVVLSEIHRWTGGNPRMTWDVCGELEDALLAGETLSSSLVEQVIRRLYLESFDRPPVDHIRVLTENDPNIRAAVLALQRGEGHSLDERAKSRLYLAGITGAVTQNVPKIKSPVVEAALPISWLEQRGSGMDALAASAAAAYESGHYVNAIRLTTDLITLLGSDEGFSLAGHFRLGMSYYYTEENEKASVSLRKALDLSGDDQRHALNYYLGVTLSRLGRFDESLEFIEAATRVDSPLQNAAFLALSSAHLASSNLSSTFEAIKVSEKLISLLKSSRETTESNSESREIMALAYLNLASALDREGERGRADRSMGSALDIAPPALRPTLIAAEIRRGRAGRDVGSLAAQASADVISCSLRLADKFGAATRFTLNDLGAILLALAEHDRENELGALFSYALKQLTYTGSIIESSTTPIKLVLTIAEGDPEAATKYIPLLSFALNGNRPSTSSDALGHLEWYRGVRHLATYSNERGKRAAYDLFSDFLADYVGMGFRLEEEDLFVVNNVVTDYSQSGREKPALTLSVLARRYAANTRGSVFSVLLQFHEMNLHYRLGNLTSAILTGENVLSALRDGREDHAPEFAEVLKNIRRGTEDLIRTLYKPRRRHPDLPLRKRIGRNARVNVRDIASGQTRSAKYKSVEVDIKEGRLVILSVEPER